MVLDLVVFLNTCHGSLERASVGENCAIQARRTRHVSASKPMRRAAFRGAMVGAVKGLLLPLAWLLLSGCTPAQPPRWAEGGANLVLGPARWSRADADDVELRPNGHVLVDGDLVFVIDRVGRVTDDDYEPFAVLQPDGQLIGTDATPLGRLGVTNASPPGVLEAWLAVLPDGQVVYFDSDGQRTSGGAWSGCSGRVLRTCTLITQLLAVQHYRAPRVGIGVGIGVGVGVGY